MLPPERSLGNTFAPDQIGWIDFETRSATADVKKGIGTYRYALEAEAIVCAYAIGDGPVRVVAVDRFDTFGLHWDQMPADFLAFHDRVLRGEAIWAAWNMGFDRAIWNYATPYWPTLAIEHTIDVMAQAVAAGLPPDLSLASKICGTPKLDTGKGLIKLFSVPGAVGTPQSHPVEWAEFLGYAGVDIEAMREVFRHTWQLSIAEWQEYHAMEQVNENGIGVDIKLARHAAQLAEQDRFHAKQELFTLTRGHVKSVDQVAVMTGWLLEHLPPKGRAILLKREEEKDEETGEVTRPAKFALRRGQVQRLLAYVNQQMEEPDVELSPDQLTGLIRAQRVLQIRLYGGSKTPAKFAKMLAQHVDGVIYGQYVFNGAAQTGRASSKGVQIQNLMRDALPYEHDAIEALLDGVGYGQFATLGDNTPVSRKLSLLIRPTFTASEGRQFVWSDWSQIEARVLPWLAGDGSPGAVERVDFFRSVDADPSQPDLYTRSAAALSGISIADVTKPIRQRGKVAELALGYMGGIGALQSMGAGYGLHFSDEEAREIVQRWRIVNKWAVDFAQALWQGMQAARDNPHEMIPVGRLNWGFVPEYLGGTMLMQLPSGRVLTYRSLRFEDVPVLDDDGEETGEVRKEFTCRRGYGRIKLWPGLFVENATQAASADFLRGTLVRLVEHGFLVRLHSHDEILIEADDDKAEMEASELRRWMRKGFWWSEGLPLMSQETIAPYYTKLGD